MTRSFSLYLDAVRFLAALLVFLWHSRRVYPYDHLVFGLGHEAVIIFFVLSGYVIAFCRDTKEKTLGEFAVNRASRIYSVALPAVLITIVLDLAVIQIAPDLGKTFADHALIRVVTSLLFLNEMWFLSIQSFSNTPYWSINYEVWYYIAFAVLAYTRRYRMAMLIAIGLLVGPKILLLAPCWWLGVWFYRERPLEKSGRGTIIAVFVASWLAFLAYINLGVGWWGWDALEFLTGPDLFKYFAFSRHFMTDYALALIVAFNFEAARVLLRDVAIGVSAWVNAIRWLAGTTFALYLLHQPVLYFFEALYSRLDLSVKPLHLVVSVTSLVVILFIGHKLEESKRVYRSWFNAVARRASSARGEGDRTRPVPGAAMTTRLTLSEPPNKPR